MLLQSDVAEEVRCGVVSGWIEKIDCVTEKIWLVRMLKQKKESQKHIQAHVDKLEDLLLHSQNCKTRRVFLLVTEKLLLDMKAKVRQMNRSFARCNFF